MGKPEHNYDYPEVRPPHPQTHLSTEPSQATSNGSGRYSWMAPPEEPHPQDISHHRRQSSVPALSIVTGNVGSDPRGQQHISRGHIQPQGQPQGQLQAHHQQQLPYSYQNVASQRGVSMYPSSPTALIHPSEYTQSYQQYQQPQPQTQPQPTVQNTELVQKPDPVKQTPNHPNYQSAIVPDENPLSPVSPTVSNNRNTMFRSQTTNLPVIPPTTTNSNFTSYAPVPQSVTGGSWTHSMCSCSQPSICLTGLFCPCVVYGRTQHRLRLRLEKKDPTNMLGYSTVNGSCIMWAALCGFNGILSGIQKTRVRRAYDMDSTAGGICGDCMAGCCCCCCVLAQNEKEIRYREEEQRGTNQEGYVPPAGMAYAPPPR